MKTTRLKRSLTSGTKLTRGSSPKIELASSDIALIIKACARHGVATLKFGDLSLSFSPQVETPRTEPTFPGEVRPWETGDPVEVPSEPHVQPPVTEMTDQERKNIERAAFEQDELTLREQQFAELMVTDPEAAEQMLVDGELDDVDDEHGDDE